MSGAVLNNKRRVSGKKEWILKEPEFFMEKHICFAFVVGLVIIPVLLLMAVAIFTAVIMAPVSFFFGWL